MESRSPDTSTLVCCVTLEWQNIRNCVARKSNFKNVTLRLVRNKFREVFLELRSDKIFSKYLLKEIDVRKKFMTEGKASISFSEQNMVLFISNAPPTQLLAFLRTMYIKLSGNKTDTKLAPSARLLSDKPNVLQEISPVTLQEINRAKSKVICDSTTPPGTKKRNLQEKGERPPGKKLCMSMPLSPGSLTEEQKEVLSAAVNGKNIFFTGSAGTGKSYLLRRIIGALPPDVTVATASTGVAACHIGGVTLHSFAGIGRGQASVKQCIELAKRPNVQQGWRKCRHLIIDEISMVDGEFFDKLEQVARAVRGNDRPFGGLQLILCGDFLQLPPVCRENEQKSARFCFQSSAWNRCIHLSFELTEVHRQSDPKFIDILQNIRIGRVTPEITDCLMATRSNPVEGEGILATRLCSHMKDVDFINSSKLDELTGTSKTYEAVDNDPYSSKILDQMTPIPSSLKLRVGAQVMLMKNINLIDGMVNGARGVVTSFSDKGLPVVRFCSKKEIAIQPERWTVRTGGGNLLTRKQIPLRLAWAFSIHKSQGLTLDCVEMSLARVFEAGQAYVALSRAKSLNTLRIVDFDPKQVWANPDVLVFYQKFRRRMQQMRIVPLGKPKPPLCWYNSLVSQYPCLSDKGFISYHPSTCPGGGHVFEYCQVLAHELVEFVDLFVLLKVSISPTGGGLNIPKMLAPPQSIGSATGNPRNKVALKPGHSLMDWVRLGNSGVDLTGVGAVPQNVTVSQLAAHNKRNDAWIAIRGKVYNVTKYMDFHPGGDDELLRGIGKDATELFNQVHAWVNYESLLHKCYVGRLVYSESNFGPPIINKASNLIGKLFIKKDKCVTMDWYQQMGSLNLQFFTRGGIPQTRVSLEDKDLVVSVRVGGMNHVTHIELEESVLWPCKIRTNYDSGKVEVVLNKVQPTMWRTLGQQQQEEHAAKQDIIFQHMEVVYITQVTHNTKLIFLRHKKQIMDSVPVGFCIQVQANLEGEDVVRSYTPIVAALHADLVPSEWRDDCLCLMVKEYPTGLMSRHICSLHLKDNLAVGYPVASLSSLMSSTQVVLLAAGTGFTPIVQVILWSLGRKKLVKMSLVFFNVSEKDILWRDQLDRLAGSDARFSVTYVLSAPSDDWSGKSGHLSLELLQELQLENQKKLDRFVFVCGPLPFNQLAQKLLGEIGYTDDQFHIFQG